MAKEQKTPAYLTKSDWRRLVALAEQAVESHRSDAVKQAGNPLPSELAATLTDESSALRRLREQVGI